MCSFVCRGLASGVRPECVRSASDVFLKISIRRVGFCSIAEPAATGR